MIPTRFGSATPCPTAQRTPSIRSSCMRRANCLIAAFLNLFPKPTEPR